MRGLDYAGGFKPVLRLDVRRNLHGNSYIARQRAHLPELQLRGVGGVIEAGRGPGDGSFLPASQWHKSRRSLYSL